MATVTFIKYQRQSAGALHGVTDYVSQKHKTQQEDGSQLVSGQNCTPQLAAQEFLATRQMHRKNSPVWFYHYVQSFAPEEQLTGALAHQVRGSLRSRRGRTARCSSPPTRMLSMSTRISLSMQFALGRERCSAKGRTRCISCAPSLTGSA